MTPLQAVLDGHARDALAADLALIACEAGEILLAHSPASCRRRTKEDGSPTSEADLAAETYILAALARAWPGVPVVAEETASRAAPGERFFLVDPLDGTRDFLLGSAEYCVCIALVEAGRPVAAAVAAPALRRSWAAGAAAWEAAIDGGRPGTPRPVRVRPPPPEGPTALVSGRHGDTATDRVLDRLAPAERRSVSSAVKFGLIASGEADLYVRCGPTMEWDIAAGDHLVTVAGGGVVGSDGRPLTYGHREREYRNGAFAALGDPTLVGSLALDAGA